MTSIYDSAAATVKTALDATYAAKNHTHSGMLTSSDIVDNLTTDNASKVLSAKQGKALKDLIGNAITYINQQDGDMI